MKKKDLFAKLQVIKPQELKKLGITQNEINYIKSKLLNDNLGLKLNFTEISNEEQVNYILLDEIEELGINKGKSNNNLLIEGDNYYALKALKTAEVKVNVIYIDPPYNTGDKDFIYNDDFSVPKYVNRDDPHKHSKWLSFMRKRLEIARELLTEDGVIFVSIDDNEQGYLRVLMDEIFGEGCFLNQLVWVSKKSGRQISSKPFAKTYEYIMVYSKRALEQHKVLRVEREYAEKNMPSIYTKSHLHYDEDEYGKYYLQYELHNLNIKKFNSETRKNLFFPIFTNGNNISLDHKDGYEKILPPKSKIGIQGVWRWSKEKIVKEKHNIFIKNKNGKHSFFPKIRTFGYTPKDIIMSPSMSTSSGSLEIVSLGIDDFSYPKPTNLIKFILKIFTQDNLVILDFFAGSGTTGQAVMELNQEDNGNRRFILCTNNEMKGIDTKKYPEKGIARAICRERIYRVTNGKGSREEEITWTYSKDIKSLSNNSLTYLKVVLLDKYEGNFEDIDKVKKVYKKEFNKNISIRDFKD